MLTLSRHIRKNKTYALINLFGLTLGLSVSIFILLYVQDEMSYDRYLPGYEQVIRIQPSVSDGDELEEWATTEGFLIPTLAPMYPEIQSATRILRNENEIVFGTETEKYSQAGVIGVDTSFFEVFPFTFIYGDRTSALRNPDGIVVTQETAHKFFGTGDPIGKMLQTDFGPVTITGVIENVPPTSHFHFSIAFPLKSWWRDADQSRNAYAAYSFLRLTPTTNPAEFSERILKDWYNKHGAAPSADGSAAANPPIDLLGMPLADIHLQSHAEKEFEANGQWQVVYVFVAVAILLLAIATVNYINLSNAMAVRRAKEVAVRKTIGASRQMLFVNFMVESFAFTFIAFALGLAIVLLFLPQFNTFTGKELELTSLLNGRIIVALLGSWIVLGFLSGFYPATLLSSFSPVHALKSNAKGVQSGNLSRYFRQGLIVSQFTISALMIVCSFTVRQQLKFIETRNVGFKKENVVVLQLTGEARRKSDIVKNEINKVKGVVSSAAASVVPGRRVMYLSMRVPELAGTIAGPQPDDGSRSIRVMSVDQDYIKTLGLTLVDGRDFSHENPGDTAEAFILNEAALREFNIKDPIGKPIEYTYGNPQKQGKIVGIVKDFNFASVHTPVEPVLIHILRPLYNTLCIRIEGKDPHGTLTEIESAWKRVTSVPFSYQFLDTNYDAMYRTERTTGRVVTSFTILAIIIAGLGLFGIVSFFVTQRIKEVGVRKAFGATHVSLVTLLSREYIVMVLIGNLVALYPAYWLISEWLQQFAYKIDLPFATFAVAFLLTEVMAFVSIIFVVMRTAKTNPATILRYE